LIRTVAQHRAHDVHLRMAGGRVAPRAVDFLENQTRLQNAEAPTAVFLWNQGGEVTRLGDFLHESLGILALVIELAPVLTRIELTQLVDGFLQLLLFVAQGKTDLDHQGLLIRVSRHAALRRFSLSFAGRPTPGEAGRATRMT
jgi:hypothetical protein